jgi:TolA-binding protein
MNTGALGAALVTLLISTQAVAAQQPEQRPPRDSAARGMMMKDMQQHMRMMDSANARLDTLVQRMNRATGNAKVAAMAQVINEMVAQRRAMQAHMHRMMQTHGRMMGGPMMMESGTDTARAHTGKPKPGGETAGTDTSGHGAHHPEM